MKKIAKHKLDKIENDKKTNYLPWILGGAGVFALLAGLIWYFTKEGGEKQW